MRQFEIRGAAISLSQDGQKKREEGGTELEEKAVNKEVCRRGRSPRRVGRGGGGKQKGRNGANLSNLADFASDLNVHLKRQRERH